MKLSIHPGPEIYSRTSNTAIFPPGPAMGNAARFELTWKPSHSPNMEVLRFRMFSIYWLRCSGVPVRWRYLEWCRFVKGLCVFFNASGVSGEFCSLLKLDLGDSVTFAAGTIAAGWGGCSLDEEHNEVGTVLSWSKEI